jgi:hypothetical protein
LGRNTNNVVFRPILRSKHDGGTKEDMLARQRLEGRGGV